MIDFDVIDNFLTSEALRELDTVYEAALAGGLKEAGSATQHFVRFQHYDAYRFLPSVEGAKIGSCFDSFFSRSYVRELCRRFNRPLANNFLMELHYHLPGGSKGTPHTDDEVVTIKDDPCKTGALRGANFYQGNNLYRTKGKPEDGCLLLRRAMIGIIYLNTIPTGGETVLFKKANDGSFTKLHDVHAIRNRLLRFNITSSSWHASEATAYERKSVALFYHV